MQLSGQLQKVIPSWPEVARETIIVMGGALAAAIIIGNMPRVRQWMKDQWDGSNPSV